MLFPAVTQFSIGSAQHRYADCARALAVASASNPDAYAAEALVAELHALNRDLKVPTPQTFGIDRSAWEEKIPLMAEQALSSGSPANNPLIPDAEQIHGLYAEIYA
jgi:alcohol dehydrogenase